MRTALVTAASWGRTMTVVIGILGMVGAVLLVQASQPWLAAVAIGATFWAGGVSTMLAIMAEALRVLLGQAASPPATPAPGHSDDDDWWSGH